MALCVFYLNKSKQQETICVHGIIATTTVTYIVYLKGQCWNLHLCLVYLDNLIKCSNVRENQEFLEFLFFWLIGYNI